MKLSEEYLLSLGFEKRPEYSWCGNGYERWIYSKKKIEEANWKHYCMIGSWYERIEEDQLICAYPDEVDTLHTAYKLIKRISLPVYGTILKNNDLQFKILPKQYFGQLLQFIYNHELNFTLEWMWDGGVQWMWEQCSYTQSQEPYHLNTQKLIKQFDDSNIDWSRDMEYVGGLIVYDLYHTKGIVFTLSENV